MLKEHQDILWLAGQAFLSRDFVKEAEDKGLEAVFAMCPYGDLSGDEKTLFEAAFKHPRLREVVALWWKTYDEARASGDIPGVKAYWET